jgi:CBS domain-containing protein
MKKCSDVMTKDLVYCFPDDLVTKAARLMKTEDIGPVLVVNNEQDKTLVGIVTDRDLALEVVGQARDPNATRVEEVMSKKLVVCHPDDNVDTAMNAMAQYQLRRIPVVAENMKVVGIIAQADVATRVGEPRETAEVVKEISQENA